MINILGGSQSWADLTLGDICHSTSDPTLWAKLVVLLLAVGATRIYFGQSVPTAIPFSWAAPRVSHFDQ
jgi:hypothetical protein